MIVGWFVFMWYCKGLIQDVSFFCHVTARMDLKLILGIFIFMPFE